MITKKPKFVIDENRCYNKTYKPKPLSIALSIQSEIISPIAGITIFSGLPKNGKSFFIAATIASYFINDELFKIKLKLPTDKPILTLFDTETPEHNFYRNVELIKKFANGHFNENNFNAFRLRSLEPLQMLELIENYILDNPNCGCVVIDGLHDLLIDENSRLEVKRIDSLLKRLTNDYNVTVIAVLHTNRGGIDTVGSLGSKMDKVCDATLLVKKNKEQPGVFELHGSLLRYATKEIDIVSIRREAGDVFEVETDKPIKKRTYKDWDSFEHRILARSCVKERGSQYKELIDEIKEKQACGINVAKLIMQAWIRENIVSKNYENLYTINNKN